VKSTGLKWAISLGLALLNVYPVKCEAYFTGAEPILSGRSIFNWGVPDVTRNIMSFRSVHGFLWIIFFLTAKTTI